MKYNPEKVSIYIQGNKITTGDRSAEEIVTLKQDLPFSLDMSLELNGVGKLRGILFFTQEQFELFKEGYNVDKSH